MSTKDFIEKKDEKDNSPNFIPAQKRIYYFIVSVGILIIITIGLFNDDLYLPGRGGRGIHLHGIPAWILYFAGLCAIANMISVVIDHYDKRKNERDYRIFAKVTQILSFIFLFLSLVLDIMIFHTMHH